MTKFWVYVSPKVTTIYEIECDTPEEAEKIFKTRPLDCYFIESFASDYKITSIVEVPNAK